MAISNRLVRNLKWVGGGSPWHQTKTREVYGLMICLILKLKRNN